MKRLGRWTRFSDRVGKIVAALGVVGILGLGAAVLAPAASAAVAPAISAVSVDCSASQLAITISDFDAENPPNVDILEFSDTSGYVESLITPNGATGTYYVPFHSFIPGNGTYWAGDESTNQPDLQEFTVDCASDTFTTQASPTATPVDIATTVGDSASFDNDSLNSQPPTGSVTFTLYSDSACTSAAGVSGNSAIGLFGGNYVASFSASWTPTEAGVYYWQATYSGDANNDPYTSPCNSSNEELTVEQASPNITTYTAVSSATLNSSGAVGDLAIFGGSETSSVSGESVSFTLYPAASCQAGTGAVASGDGTIFFDPYPFDTYVADFSTTWTPTDAGTYDWVASYPGDANNAAYTSGCADPDEQVVVPQDTPCITTHLSKNRIWVDGWVTDTATLSDADSGATDPANGAITISLYKGRHAWACSGRPVWRGTETATPNTAGDGTYTASFWVPFAGDYELQASFAGDPNDQSATSRCGTELLRVSQDQPWIRTHLHDSTVTYGDSVTDSAYLWGAADPDFSHHDGTITINAYSYSGSGKPCCLPGTAVASETGYIWIHHGRAYYSATFNTATAGLNAGEYELQAYYSGDQNDQSAASRCGTELLTVNQDPAAITTQLTSGTASSGGSATDTATLSDVSSTADGTITISLYSGNTAAACTGTATTLTATPATSGPGAYAVTFTNLSTGSYELQANFLGDQNDTTAASTCGTELLTVSKPVGGQLAASTGTPVTGANLAGPGLAGLLALLLGSVL
ncbi:MAG: hypothetical protein WBA31_05000, partial [Candidatus Dormiibacterota bacterium]